jgi:hypothetical protein
MKIQPVDNSLQILRVFSLRDDPTGLGVNEIFKKTGSKDKKPITDAIKYLEKARILETKRSSQHIQVRLKKPTTLGKEFIDFMNNIDGYNIACVRFRDKVKQIQNILAWDNEKLIRSKLREKGWNQDEIKSFKELMNEVIFISHDFASPSAIINVIIIRYISLLAKLSSYDDNELASQVLYRIIMKAISDQFRTIISSYKLDKVSFAYNSLTLDKWNLVIGSAMKTGLLEHSFIKKEFEDLIFHNLHTLTPTEEQAKVLVKEISDMADLEKDERYARRARLFQSIIEEAYRR